MSFNSNQLTNPTALTKREQYLLQTLRLQHDPFAYATAEQELRINPQDPPFFSYFVDPPFKPGDGSLLEKLKDPLPACIYGDAGSGKTTLRYALEALCRTLPDRTLVVSYTIGKVESADPETPELLKTSLSHALATDLFVQTLEQFNTLETALEPETIQTLSHYWHATIPNFGRNLQRHLERGQPKDITGISIWWSTWQRAVVRYTPLTPELTNFLKRLLTNVTTDSIVTNGQIQFQQGVNLARRVGYRQVYVLIDVVDASQKGSLDLEARIEELLLYFSSLSTNLPLYPKLFLPKRLQSFLKNSPGELSSRLTDNLFSAIINWSDSEALLQIVVNRFRSAGSRIRGFDVIASQDIAEQLNGRMIESAHQSPRRLLRIATSLIDAHANREPESPLLTAADWQQMRQMWNYGDPKPTPLNEDL